MLPIYPLVKCLFYGFYQLFLIAKLLCQLWIIIGLIRVFHSFFSIIIISKIVLSINSQSTCLVYYFYQLFLWAKRLGQLWILSFTYIPLHHYILPKIIISINSSTNMSFSHSKTQKKEPFYYFCQPFCVAKLLGQLWIFNKLISHSHISYILLYHSIPSKTILSIYSLIKYTRNPTSHNKTENGSVAPPWPPLQQPNVAQKEHPKKE